MVNKQTVLDSWPAVKEDLMNFLADTDAWIIAEMVKAHQARDWDKVAKIVEVMESVHDLSHSH